MLYVKNFKVENMTAGCLTDKDAPVFSWEIESDQPNTLMKNARLTVNGAVIDSYCQTGAAYNGPPLQPFTEYTAQVEVTSNFNETAAATVCFSTGYRNSTWNAQWITDADYHFTEKKTSPVPMLFRRQFAVSKKVKKATLYSTALGIYEIMLNGKKVGRDYFAPGFTSYKNQLQYQHYDVTDLLEKDNRLLVTVAGGWAVGAYTYGRRNRLYADRQALLCELQILYEDGNRENIGTDTSWQVSENGPYRAAEFYDGETFDAAIEIDSISWHQAAAETLRFEPKLFAQYGVPVRAHEHFVPVSCTRSPSGVWIYDMGQNFSGVVQAVIRGHKGQKVTFSHAEILMDGELYTKPLRSARQQAIYICKDGEQFYSPRLTCMGFRYVGVEGIEPENIELSAVALYSDMPQSGDFACSDERLNQMQRAIVWGAKSNFVDIPTDCPQRDERLGWTGDIALFAPTAAWNFDTSRFFDKWLLDVKSEQGRGGGIPMIVPQVKIPGQFEQMVTMAVDHWGDACILVPWAEYLARGNQTLLRRMYPVMKKYIKACTFWAGLFSTGQRRYIWKLLFHYGDWCAPDTGYNGWLKRGKWTATACLAHSSGIVAQIAGLLGEKEDATFYAQLSRKTAQAYRNLLMTKDCRVEPAFQTGYVLPLYYGLLENNDRKKAALELDKLVQAGNYNIQTGFPGTPYILFALADNGYLQDAYKMLLNDTCPSWLYEIKVGGTTFWERWDALREDGSCNQGESDGGIGMVSFNHYACGAVGDFLYRRVAGIEQIEGGYRVSKIAPKPGGGLKWAKANVQTPYGELSSEWHIKEGKFRLTIQVPAGTECVVTLPSGADYRTGSGKWEYEEASCEQ